MTDLTVSVLLGASLGAIVAWLALRWLVSVRMPLGVGLALLAALPPIAVMWAWAAHVHMYPATFGPFTVTLMMARALWSVRRGQ